MPADPTLTVSLRPGLAALNGVLSVLHARVVDVLELSCVVERDDALLHLSVTASREQAERLAMQIDRRVDVLEVIVDAAPLAPERTDVLPTRTPMSVRP